MRIEWKSELHGVTRCPAEYKVLGGGEPAGTFEAYVAIFGTPDRPDFFGDSDIIEPGAFTQTLQEKGLPPIVWSHVWTIPPVGQALHAVEDAKRLRIKARLFLDDDGNSGQSSCGRRRMRGIDKEDESMTDADRLKEPSPRCSGS